MTPNLTPAMLIGELREDIRHRAAFLPVSLAKLDALLDIAEAAVAVDEALASKFPSESAWETLTALRATVHKLTQVAE
jgi:hypothetical protein